jgi:hypothetical protein
MRILSCLEVRDQTRVPQDPHVVQLSLHPRFHGALPRDVTSKEIELWVKHMRPYMRSGEMIDYDSAKQAMLDWHADMQEHGLATYGAEEWEVFLNPEPRS